VVSSVGHGTVTFGSVWVELMDTKRVSIWIVLFPTKVNVLKEPKGHWGCTTDH
jgi:hypothetical protein